MKYYLLLLSFLLLLLSCSKEECLDCTQLFQSEFSTEQLDTIVRNILIDNSSDSIYYTNWEEFASIKFNDLFTIREVCTKSGFMVSVDPLSRAQEFKEVWYSNGSSDSVDVNFFEVGFLYNKCE
tara:strand:+ start:147 stop:518 length:372 start_codon:yes stop_codon:yes gene_type:complete